MNEKIKYDRQLILNSFLASENSYVRKYEEKEEWNYHYPPKIPVKERSSFIKKEGKKIYWEDYGDKGEYVKIIKTGQIIRKDKAEKVLKQIIEEAFLENL